MSPLCRKSNRFAACGALLLHGLLFVPVFLGASIAYEMPDIPLVESMYITLGEATDGAPAKGDTLDIPPPPPEEPAPQVEEIAKAPEQDTVNVKPRPEPKKKPKVEKKPAQKPKTQQQAKARPAQTYGHPAGAERTTSQGGSLGGPPGQQARMNAISALLARLEKEKRYPNSARRMGLEGQVIISVELNKQGAISSYRLGSSSGVHPILQKSAMQAMERVRKKWQPVAVSGAITVQVPLRFELR